MKVYLAGKISSYDWRHELVPGLSGAYGYNDPEEMNGGHEAPMIDWDEMPMKHGLTYVGPFFASCDHSCTHRTGYHAWNDGCLQSPVETFTWRTAQLCRNGIAKCDVFFAWMGDGETAYGTLVEIGIAHTLGKKVVLVWPPRQDCQFCIEGCISSDCATNRWGCVCNCTCKRDELWFAAEHAHRNLSADDPVAAFNVYMSNLMEQCGYAEDLDRCESPLEKSFFSTYYGFSPGGEIRQKLRGLVVQHQVTVNGKNYRLDFAIPGKKIAFEMDGYTYHGKEREHFNRDRRRDLDLKLAGWEVHRFDGDMIRENPVKVVEYAAQLVALRPSDPSPPPVSRAEQLRRLPSREREKLKAEWNALEQLKQELGNRATDKC